MLPYCLAVASKPDLWHSSCICIHNLPPALKYIKWNDSIFYAAFSVTGLMLNVGTGFKVEITDSYFKLNHLILV